MQKSTVSGEELRIMAGRDANGENRSGDIRTQERRRVWAEANERALKVLQDHPRPKTLGECPTERPCPYVSCRYHLYLEVGKDGSIQYPFGEVELEDLPATCAFDVVEQGGVELQIIGKYMNISRERVRQIEEKALHRFKKAKVEALHHENRMGDPDVSEIPEHHFSQSGMSERLLTDRANGEYYD